MDEIKRREATNENIAQKEELIVQHTAANRSSTTVGNYFTKQAKKCTKSALILCVTIIAIVFAIALALYATSLVRTSKADNQSKSHWCIIKDYRFDDMQRVNDEWIIGWNSTLFQIHNPVMSEWGGYLEESAQSTVFIRDGSLIARAFSKDGIYFPAIMQSKLTYTPSSHQGRKMRYEITAKVPTIAGACPFIYLYGASDMYGDGIEQRGQISIMEWNQRLDNNYATRLVWQMEADHAINHPMNRDNMSTQFYTYGIELSNRKQDGSYIKFYRHSIFDNLANVQIISSDRWIWSDDFSACSRTYDANANRCSLLAPFDNPMNIIVGIYAGDEMCGSNSNISTDQYNILHRGVEMEISKIVISALHFNDCE